MLYESRFLVPISDGLAWRNYTLFQYWQFGNAYDDWGVQEREDAKCAGYSHRQNALYDNVLGVYVRYMLEE